MRKTKRSGHKKSTAGCAACKRRHLKCDENRPSCVNCTVQKRRCPYLDDSQKSGLPTPQASSATASPIVTTGLSTTAASTPSVRLDLPRSPLELVYVELIQQWLHETHRSFVFSTEHAEIYGSTTLNYALVSPFLMHAILAFSALHLSTKHPEKRDFYTSHANELQSRGITDFKPTIPNLDETSILPAFLFSNITSAHQMCVCLSDATQDLDLFLDRFINCLQLCRGVNIVLSGWWEVLMESELKPILKVSTDVRSLVDVDQHTSELDNVRLMIKHFESANSSKTTDTYQDSMVSLQRALNVQKALDSDELNQSISWAFAWPTNVPLELINLLEMRRPEAVVILAHYMPLLYYRRFSWVVHNAGFLIYRSLEQYLGSKWRQWLTWPNEIFRDV